MYRLIVALATMAEKAEGRAREVGDATIESTAVGRERQFCGTAG